MRLGLFLALTDRRSGGISVSIGGLTDGLAEIGDEASITSSAAGGETVTARRWGSTEGGTQYGTGANPTSLVAGEGGSLFAGIQVDGVWYYREVSIYYPAPTLSAISDDAFDIAAGDSTYDVSSNGTFSGTGTWSLPTTVAGVTINSSTGVISYTAASVSPVLATTITVRLADSASAGRYAEQSFSLQAYDVPATFPDDWTWVDDETGGEATATIVTLPSANASPITDIEVKVDAGAWTSTARNTVGTIGISGLTDGVASAVSFRAVNLAGAGAASSTQNITTSDTTSPVTSGGTLSGSTLSLTSDEAGTCYWYVSDNATETAATVVGGGGLASGNFAVSSGSNNEVVDVSAAGAGDHYMHTVVQDAAGNNSAVISTAFTLTVDALLLESGDFLLLETGTDNLLLE